MRNRSVTYSTESTFHALADPTRRAVLDMLRRGRQPAGQIAQWVPVSRPAISRHRRLLRRALVVEERKPDDVAATSAPLHPVRAGEHRARDCATSWARET